MGSPDHKNYEHCYEASFEEALTELGLTGRNFGSFWVEVEAIMDFDPFNIYAAEVPETEGFWLYPTEPAHKDIPALYVLYSVEREPIRKIHYFGLAKSEDWTYPEF